MYMPNTYVQSFAILHQGADAAALLDISMAFFSRPKVFVLGLCVARVIHTLSLSTLFMDVGLFADGLILYN